MTARIKLKNADKYLLLDEKVYQSLKKDKFFIQFDVFNNAREHSSGSAVFQKYFKTRTGFKVETVYFSQYIAMKFMKRPKSNRKLFVACLNANKLDCRLENLSWMTMSDLSHLQKFEGNSTGYKGVTQKPDGKFVAMLWHNLKPLYLGSYDTAIDAAKAYTKKHLQLFGKTPNTNTLNADGTPIKKIKMIKPRKRNKASGPKVNLKGKKVNA